MEKGRRALNKQAPSQRRWLIVLCAALALALAVAGLLLLGHPTSRPVMPTETTRPSASPSATPTVSASATPTPTPTPTTAAAAPSPEQPPPPPAIPPASEPVTITFDRIGLKDVPVAHMQAPATNGGVIEPPTNPQNPDVNFMPYWISSFGKPGANASDTVYIVGHACMGDCVKPAWEAFNRLGNAEAGDRITFRTQTGLVTYEVTKKIINRKDVPEEKADTWEIRPGEMRIIACYPADFEGQNVTVFGKLVQ